MNTKLMSGIGQYHTHEPGKANRKPYPTITFEAIRGLVDKPQQCDKTHAQWVVPSSLPTRNFKEQEARGVFWLLWADLDDHPPRLADLFIILVAMLGGCDFELYNSRSATADNQKARILIFLDKSLGYADWNLAQEILNDKLEALNIIPDRANERAAQLCYMPNRGEFYSSLSKRYGVFFNPVQAFSQEIAAKREIIEAERLELETARQASIAKRATLSLSAYPSIYEAFNAVYTPQDWLIKAGYAQKGDTFRHPQSETGNYSASVKPDAHGLLRVNTLSSNDPLYTGKAGAHDAFSTFCTLFHGGDARAALKDAGNNLLAIGQLSWNRAVQIEYAKQQAQGEEKQLESINSTVTTVTTVTATDDAACTGNDSNLAIVTTVTDDDFIDDDDSMDDDAIVPKINRPCYAVYDDWFALDGKNKKAGVYYHGLRPDKDGEAKETDDYICDPLHIDAGSCDSSDHNFGLMLRFKNQRNRWRLWLMPLNILSGSCEELRGELLHQGLRIDHHKRNHLPGYLQSQRPEKQLECALKVGWHGACFVLPDRVIGNRDDIFFQTDHVVTAEYSQCGTLEQWQQNISCYCTGNPLLLFQASIAFAGALLKKCHIDYAGFHIFGDTSKGKSTGHKIAGSVWGGEGFRKSWKATGNGLEAAAVLYNDCLLALDELGDSDAREVNQVIYALGNGTGKQRANVRGTARPVHKWRIVLLSNGEKTLESHFQEKGLSVKAGQSVRFLQVPIFGKYGAFDELHGMKDGRLFSDTLQKNTADYYGAAGIAYLEKLVNDIQDFGALLEKAIQCFVSEDMEPQEQRGARAFALVAVAGELATEYEITAWTRGAAIEAALECFKQWREHRGKGATEDKVILESIKDFIDRFGDSRFTPSHDYSTVTTSTGRAGYYDDGANGRTYLFNAPGLKEAALGYDKKRITEALTKAGWLTRASNGEPKKQQKINGKNDKFYFVTLPECSQ